MEEKETIQTCELNFRQLSRELVDQYAPTARRAPKITDWPDELIGRDLVIYDQATDQVVADVNFNAGPDDRASLTLPADYTPPLQREPFASIDTPETLPPAGGLIYEIIDLVDLIVMSPHAERTNCRKLGSLIERLHEQYSYSPEAIRTRLVAEVNNGAIFQTDKIEPTLELGCRG